MTSGDDKGRSPQAADSPSTFPRWSLCALCLLHAPIFAWAAYTLPWRSWTVLSVLSLALAVAHVATAVAAGLRHRRLALVWRVSSVLSLAYGLYVGWSLIYSAWYVGSTYRGLGEGVAAALGAVVGLVVLVTVPVALWGIAKTGGVRPNKKLMGAVLIALLLAGGRLAWVRSETRGTDVGLSAMEEVGQALTTAVTLDKLPKAKGRVPLMTVAPAECEHVPSEGRVTLVATFLVPDGKKSRAVSRCFQAATGKEVVAAFSEAVAKAAVRSPIKIDLVTRVYDVPADAGLVASLAFRAGLDGACAENGRCLMPWQLVAVDAFVSASPIRAVPDARLGVSVELLGKRLSAEPSAVTRIATQGWLIPKEGGLLATGRTPRAKTEVTPETVERATDDAARYVYLAQKKDGRFKYIVMPYTGRLIEGRFSIARQAGTTLSACELSKEAPWSKRLIDRSLKLLAKHEQPFSLKTGADAGVLRWEPKGSVERIGPSALAMVAFLACRHRAGERYDGLIGRLAATLLSLQREDGSFHHYVDTATGDVHLAKGSIFVDGQVVMALSLLEKIAADEAGVFPAKAVLHAAVERAMTYFGTKYWDIPLEPFLYIEENWHCIAAAASLGHHRHEAYEQFCLDYVAMKKRIIHEPGGAVHEDFIGGYGFGNIVPPHNTATAGYGEALSAAIKIKHARGLDTAEDEQRMQLVIGFLLRNQWDRASCYACTTKHRIIGGFSEHMASSRIRIDYVQHVWAAIGHGAIALGWREEASG